MEEYLCRGLILAAFLINTCNFLVEGVSSPQCAGKVGTVMFMPTNINGNVTGIQRYSKRGKGQTNMQPFANYNTGNGKITHFEINRNITVVDKYNLQFASLQKSDDGDYSLSLSVQTESDGVESRDTESTLTVKDPCFAKAEMVGKCYKAKCLTSNGGKLTYKGEEQRSMQIEVCDKTGTGTYNCCSPAGECFQQTIADPEEARKKEEEEEKGKQTVIIVVSVVCPIVAIGIIVLAVIHYRRRQIAGKDGRVEKKMETPNYHNKSTNKDEVAK